MTVILGSRSETPEQLVNDAGLGALLDRSRVGPVGLGCGNAER